MSGTSSRWRKALMITLALVALVSILVDTAIDRTGGCTGGFLNLLPDCHFTAAQLFADLQLRFIFGAMFLSLATALTMLSRAFRRMMAVDLDHKHKIDAVFCNLCDAFCGVAVAAAILNFIW